MTLESILKGGYDGRVYPVNPRGGELLGLKVYKSLSQLPGRPDLVVILVPARFVPGVLREAAGQGIPGAVILSAGFREAGRADLEEEIAAIARETGLRFAGPNIQDQLPAQQAVRHVLPGDHYPGPLAVVAQSGSSYGGPYLSGRPAKAWGSRRPSTWETRLTFARQTTLNIFQLTKHRSCRPYLEGIKMAGAFWKRPPGPRSASPWLFSRPAAAKPDGWLLAPIQVLWPGGMRSLAAPAGNSA